MPHWTPGGNFLADEGILVSAVHNSDSWQAQATKANWFHLDPQGTCFTHAPQLARLLNRASLQPGALPNVSSSADFHGWLWSLMNRSGRLPPNALHLSRAGRAPGKRWGLARGCENRIRLFVALTADIGPCRRELASLGGSPIEVGAREEMPANDIVR